MLHRLFPAAFLIVTCVVATSTLSRAGQLSFNIDPAQSHITLTLETADGTQIISSPQTPGSDTTSLSGTLNADLTASTIQFLPTGDTQFALQSVPQSPLGDGSAGSAPAQYGLSISVPGAITGVVAGRSYVGDATSGVIPLAGGAYDASQLTLGLLSGITGYNLLVLGSPAVGSFNTNFPAPNSLTGGTFTESAGVYTITAPILASGLSTVDGVTLVDVFSGQVVATATVPEPASMLLAAIGVAMLFCCRRRRV
jgi:hypothetical protein